MKCHDKAWSTLNGVEIFVVRTGTSAPDTDGSPERVALLVEWLRKCYAHFGGWTEKPAPLHFGLELKAYLADYELEEEEDIEETESEDENGEAGQFRRTASSPQTTIVLSNALGCAKRDW